MKHQSFERAIKIRERIDDILAIKRRWERTETKQLFIFLLGLTDDAEYTVNPNMILECASVAQFQKAVLEKLDEEYAALQKEFDEL